MMYRTYTKKSKNTKDASNRGNWEFNFYQKVCIIGHEQSIKFSMRPENSFDPSNIHYYIANELSREEKIYEKKKAGDILSKTECIILDNYIKKKNETLANDLELIDKFGLNAKPVTKEGRTRLLLLTLQSQLLKNNSDLICNIFLRLSEDQFELTDKIESEFIKNITKMNTIVSNCDLINLQFTKLHDQMPPLNTKGFQKFDPWQINVIQNIDAGKSTIVSAPTSAGKSVLSGYATTKGKTMIVVPTDALAWQMASYIGGILNADIPIITQTYQTSPKRTLMVELINNSPAIVGTADTIIDYLPLISTKFDWIIFDEIHMIGKTEGKAMETIAKVYDTVPFLALSATIGNIGELHNWFASLNPDRPISNIICDKRFFNLQRYYYNPTENKLEMLHPLSLVNLEDFRNKSILMKTLQPTPPDIWALYNKIIEHYGIDAIGSLKHTIYFGINERIQLSKANQFFNDLIKFMVDNYNEIHINAIINSFKNPHLLEESVDLVKLAFLLKEEDKTPAIIFQKNTVACLRIIRQFAKIVNELEDTKYPKLRTSRLKEQSKAKRLDKQKDKKEKEVKMDSNKAMKEFLNFKIEIDTPISVSVQEPTREFTFNSELYFSEGIVDDWVLQLKKYFPNCGDEYHFIIKLLWRGVGIYAKGLPDPYLRLVQSLASKKQLAIVFSDMSLVFGVSMPFRTVVIYRDATIDDDLDGMLYHQMVGRAGRRGLDKKGNIIFAGYKWDRIEELSVCPIPNVVGTNTLNYVIPHANRIALSVSNGQQWDKTFLNCLNKEPNEDTLELSQSIVSNYENSWNFAISDDINQLHMMWILRSSSDDVNEPVIASFIIPYLKKGFEGLDPNNVNNQVLVAHFLSHFINKYQTDKSEYVLPQCPLFEQPSFLKIYDFLEELQLNSNTDNIDGRVWYSIKENKIIKCSVEKEADEIRNRVFEFGNKVKAIQHYCFHSKFTNLSKLLGKLLTRIWWIYHMSSPIMKPFNQYDENEYEVHSNSDSDDSDDKTSELEHMLTE